MPLVPIVRFAANELPSARLADFTRYRLSRQFYVPAWPGLDGGGAHFVADFTGITPLARNALREGGPVELLARMELQAWALLHACLIRFFARDDGRHDV